MSSSRIRTVDKRSHNASRDLLSDGQKLGQPFRGLTRITLKAIAALFGSLGIGFGRRGDLAFGGVAR